MAQIKNHPLYGQSHETNAALIEACGRVFSASLSRDQSGSPAQRDNAATASVNAFLDGLAKD